MKKARIIASESSESYKVVTEVKVSEHNKIVYLQMSNDPNDLRSFFQFELQFFIFAPWTDEEVAILKERQNNDNMHPYTCMSGNENTPNCERANQTGEGLLEPTKDGWVCPCKGYVQNWAHFR
jgi:hypothetical protein